ncbi:uncharacterized protein L3040_007460 [Drepanopeziza brunnea f. sp. 'multigermtubi']|uniref:uncharacterized protein n=1 Tax=Drepanopeziza brunnea f. sp. 'multigermtubi' TaxID=698441 RepID=UPI002398411D|nr:hypothetical protein L3040_007460 [Drepanopeziza brunnea f. sp. 'multigermtubi']
MDHGRGNGNGNGNGKGRDAIVPSGWPSTSTIVPSSYPPSAASGIDTEKGSEKEGGGDGEPDATTFADSPYSGSENVEEETRSRRSTRPASFLYPAQSDVEKPVSLSREIAFVGVLCTAQLFTQASLGQAIAPLHIIGASFGETSPGQLSWFPAAYSLTVGTFILIAGRLGDLYGHKRLFTAGFVWYGVWSLLAGFTVYIPRSSSPAIFFDVCRAMQGIGPAFLLPNALAILGRTYAPGRRKEMIFAIFGATAPSGFVLGAVFASLFAQRAWWPWAYWTMGLCCFGMAIAGLVAIPPMPVPASPDDDGGNRGGSGSTTTSAFARVDGYGCITGVAALVLINFAWNQGPVAGWTTPYTYGLLLAGFAFLALFACVERRAAHPLLPRAALTKDTAFVLACMAAGWASFGIWIFYLWQFLQRLRHASPLLASAMVAPTTVSGLAAALTTGRVLHRCGPGAVMVVAMLAFALGTVLLATAPVGQSYWAQTFVAVVVMPWGMDMSFPAATILLSDRMPRGQQGVAASLVNTVVNYSVSIGLGFAGTVESRVGTGEGDEALLRGYRGAWYMGLGLAGLGVCVSVVFGGSQLLDRRIRKGMGKGFYSWDLRCLRRCMDGNSIGTWN